MMGLLLLVPLAAAAATNDVCRPLAKHFSAAPNSLRTPLAYIQGIFTQPATPQLHSSTLFICLYLAAAVVDAAAAADVTAAAAAAASAVALGQRQVAGPLSQAPHLLQHPLQN